MGHSPEAPRDRRVVLAIGLLVAGLLAASVVSAVVPGMDAALAAVPVVIGLLVVGTVVVLVRSLRGRPG
jgi:CHASE2 domain-containing sensor protein